MTARLARLPLLALAACATAGGPDAPVLPDLSGRPVALGALRGRVVLMPFFATWCQPCAAELTAIEQLWRRHRERGLAVVGVAVDGPATAAELPAFVARHGLSFPIVHDAEARLLDRHHPRGTLPFWVVLDREGRPRAAHQGYVPGDEVEIERAVLDLL